MIEFVLGAILAAAFFRPGAIVWIDTVLTIVCLPIIGLGVLALLLVGLEALHCGLCRFLPVNVVGWGFGLSCIAGIVWICVLATV